MSKIFVGSSIDPDLKNTLDALKSGAIDEKNQCSFQSHRSKCVLAVDGLNRESCVTNRQ